MYINQGFPQDFGMVLKVLQNLIKDSVLYKTGYLMKYDWGHFITFSGACTCIYVV